MENLTGKTIKGLSWNLLEGVGIQVLQFVPTVILARLLAPEQFGLIGMLTLFIALATTFLDSGFGMALIRKKDATHVDECSIFYFNILVGVLSVLILFVLAPLIAAFYKQPLLIPLTRWLSLDILVNAFGLIQITILTRKIDFKTQFIANIAATVASGVIGVAAAYLGMGIWSLVISTISETLMGTATLWLMCDWRPSLTFSMDSLKGMFGFGSRMLLSSLISTFFDNLYQVFIGKVFSATLLGYYTRASSIKSIAIDTTSGTLGRVAYPALASIQNDLVRLKRAYRRIMLLTTFFHFPMMVGLIVIARPLIDLLFTAKWDSTVIFFQLMCIAGLLYPLQLINLDILKVKGRSDLYFHITVIKRCLVILTIIITYRWGINAILIGQIVISVIAYGINSYYSEKLIDYPVKNQLWDVFPSLLIACLMGGGLWFIGNALHHPGNFVILVIQISVGVILYSFLHFIIRSESLFEGVTLAKQFLFSRASS
jgi:teichuronic acid exporter